uniref:Uncharacterized protein n=1 Tax=Arion vulgaris TaxID=1028688 RepID=A0A0B7AEL5_9EUPU
MLLQTAISIQLRKCTVIRLQCFRSQVMLCTNSSDVNIAGDSSDMDIHLGVAAVVDRVDVQCMVVHIAVLEEDNSAVVLEGSMAADVPAVDSQVETAGRPCMDCKG